jgi:sugar lactone lactonase YvrE
MRRRVARATLVLACLALSVAPARAQTSWGVGVLSTGDVFFCDSTRERVWRLDRAGHLSVAIENTPCHALVVGPDGGVYGESIAIDTDLATANLAVWRLGLAGRRQWLQPPTPAPDPATWLVVDKDGRQYAWNGAENGADLSQITRRDRSGAVAILAGGAWGGRDGVGEQARLGAVGGIALAPDGTLVVADSGNVRRINSGGVVRTEAVGVLTGTTGAVTRRAGLWGHTMGVATDTDGSAVVIDYAARRIIRVARDGRVRELWHSAGLANAITRSGWGWRPTGVAMLGSSYYVMETWPLPSLLADLVGSPRLLLVQPDGSSTPVASVSNWLVRAAALLLVVTLASWANTSIRRRPRTAAAAPAATPRT